MWGWIAFGVMTMVAAFFAVWFVRVLLEVSFRG